MTSTTSTSTTAATRAAGYLAAVGTVPYLGLKAAWLTGSTVGFTDAALAVDPTLRVANAITAAMDLVVVALALALTHRWGRRLPAWLVLIPMWVGTGFLLPITLTLLPAAATGGLAAPEDSPFEPWLQPLVYGGFAWQGVMLGIAFVLHTRSRWGGVWEAAAGAEQRTPTQPAQVVLAGGAAALAAVVGGLRISAAVVAPSAAQILIEGVHGLLALAGAIGVLALVQRRSLPGPAWLPVVLGWTGSSALFSWGTYTTVIALSESVFGRGAPLPNLTGFASALAGLALAMVGITELADRHSRARLATPP